MNLVDQTRSGQLVGTVAFWNNSDPGTVNFGLIADGAGGRFLLDPLTGKVGSFTPQSIFNVEINLFCYNR